MEILCGPLQITFCQHSDIRTTIVLHSIQFSLIHTGQSLNDLSFMGDVDSFSFTLSLIPASYPLYIDLCQVEFNETILIIKHKGRIYTSILLSTDLDSSPLLPPTLLRARKMPSLLIHVYLLPLTVIHDKGTLIIVIY